MDELEIRQPGRALLADPGVERLPRRPVGPVVLLPKGVPFGSIVRRQARVRRRDVRPPNLERIARHDANEWLPGRHERRETDDVVLDDDVRPLPLDDLAELRLAVARAVDERLPGRLHECRELLDRRLAELGRRVADEVLPELAGVLRAVTVAAGILRGRGEIDEILDEAEGLELAGP